MAYFVVLKVFGHRSRPLNSSLVRQAQLGASYRVPCRKVGSPNRVKPNQQPVPSVARLAEPIFANCELYGEQ